MKTLLLHLTLLVLVALPAEGQDRGRNRGGDEGGSNVVTGKTGARSLVPVNVSVGGLDSPKAGRVTEALSSLTHDIYACSRCAVRTRREGKCAHCEEETDVALVESTKVFSRIAFSTDRGRLIVTARTHQWASLAELERIVTEAGGRVERGRFRLPGNSRIKITGVDSSHTRRVRGALVDLGVLDRVIVTADKAGVWIVPLEETRVSVAEIEDVLKRLSPEYAVEDVQWAAYCPHCGKVPTMRMGGPNCRER